MARVLSAEQIVAEGGGGTCHCEECRSAYRYPTLEAVRRAEELLDRFLTPAQRRTWKKFGWIEVIGSQGNRYRLCPSSPGTYDRVVRLNDRAVRLRVCGREVGYGDIGLGVWPRGLRIAADWVLSMMLYLQAGEGRVDGIACRGTPGLG